MDEITLMQSMTEAQRLFFQSEMAHRRKNPAVAFVLTFFLGGIGAHRFYLGQVGLGVVYALTCWTFIPIFVSLIECFVIVKRTERYNERVAMDAAIKVRALAPVTAQEGR